jgi:hypothetical protein
VSQITRNLHSTLIFARNVNMLVLTIIRIKSPKSSTNLVGDANTRPERFYPQPIHNRGNWFYELDNCELFRFIITGYKFKRIFINITTHTKSFVIFITYKYYTIHEYTFCV